MAMPHDYIPRLVFDPESGLMAFAPETVHACDGTDWLAQIPPEKRGKPITVTLTFRPCPPIPDEEEEI
jgi:hypothetical protein